MKRLLVSVTCALAFLLSAVSCDAAVKLRVTGDRVNLRAAPDSSSEKIGQLSDGDLLLTDKFEGEWIAVVPPSSVDLWVYGELVRGDVVAVSDLRVRSGPGISYRPVGRLGKGQKVEIRGSEGDWLRIVPPSGCTVWISRDYVERVHSPEPPARHVEVPSRVPRRPPASAVRSQASPRVVTPQPTPKPQPVPPPQPEKVVPIRKTEDGQMEARFIPGTRHPDKPVEGQSSSIDPESLVASRKQGEPVSLTGILSPSGWVWRRPSRYRLVQYDSLGRAVTACYVLGDEERLKDRLGMRVTIHGKAYWVQGVRHKVVVITD